MITIMMVLLCNKIIVPLIKGRQKGRVDEADISSLPLEMHLASCGLDGQHQLEMPSHIEEPKIKTQKCYA